MALINEMAKGIREHEEAFADLNNNDDPTKQDSLTCAIQQTYRNLRDLRIRYDTGER
jgi:hypothetical protein